MPTETKECQYCGKTNMEEKESRFHHTTYNSMDGCVKHLKSKIDRLEDIVSRLGMLVLT